MPPAGFTKRRSDVIAVRGTGVPATDNATFAAAVAAANAYYAAMLRPATIQIDGNLHITTEHLFTSPTGLECTRGSWLVRENTTAKLSYNNLQGDPFQYSAASFGEMSNTAAGSGVISLPSSFQLQPTQWVLVYGFNEITDTTPHGAATKSYPMELQRINRRAKSGTCNTETGSRCDYVFDDYLDEAYQTATINGVTRAPRVAIVPNMMGGIRIRNFNYRMKDGAASAGTSPTQWMAALFFERCYDIEVTNCSFGEWHPGTMHFRYCANVRRHGCRWSSVEQFAFDSEDGLVYGILDSICNQMDIQHCQFGGMRHAYTTGGAAANLIHSSSTSDRVGSVKSVLIHGNKFGNNGRLNAGVLSGVSIVNPHEEGRRITISDNTFYIPGEEGVQNRGITVRFRDAVIRGNSFFCGPAATPIQVHAARATIANNTFDGGLRIQVDPSSLAPTYGAIDRVRIAHNTFRNFASPAVWINAGTDHEIIGNTFHNCGYLAITGFKKAAIEIAALSAGGTVRIKDNSIVKYANDFSVYTGPLAASQVILDGNLCTGYGNLSLGLDRELPNTPEIEMVSLSRNNGSCKAVVVQQAAHGLTAAMIGQPVTASHAIYNDVASGFGVIGVLADRINADHYALYLADEPFVLPATLIATGYSFPASGRNLYWDNSLAKYTPTKPGDSASDSVPIIRVHASKPSGLLVSVSQFSAAVAPPAVNEAIGLAVSDETTNLTAGTGKLTFRMPFPMFVTSVRGSVNTAPTGSTIIVDVNEDGVTLFSTRLSIDAGEKSSTTAASQAVIDNGLLAEDAEITVDIDQVGSTVPGKGLKLWLQGIRL
jgi:hypothetical protein